MNVKRAIFAGLLAAGLTAAVAAPASAGQPANQGCLGHDFSGYAQAGLVGGFVSQLATTTQGIGNEVQAHLAGQVPDTIIPNSCNN